MNTLNLKPIYKEAPYFQPLVSTLIIYLIFLYLLTLNPFRFSMFYFYRFIQFRRGYLAAFIGGSNVQDILLNLIMLFPLGLVIGLILRIIQIIKKRSIIVASGLGFLVSLSIETCQIFLPRSFSGIDIIANTMGAAIGAWLAYPVSKFDSQEIFRNLYDKGRLFYSRIIILYCMVATVILMIPVSVNTFSSWNGGFHFLIGNEATLDRPWSGVIYKLSIFNRTIRKQEVEKFQAINLQQETPAELSNGLLVEYIFTEPEIKRFGTLKNNLELSSLQNSSLEFKPNGGILLTKNLLLGTQMPARDLVQALKRTNQLSIAIWFEPENLMQRGPARIVTLSKDTDHRNFTLGQSGSNLNFRVRTPITGFNGSEVYLTTHSIIAMEKPQFVVATFHRGEMKLYYNGKIVSPVIYDTSSFLPSLAGLSQDRFGKAAFCFMLLFPLGWLARGLTISKVWKSFVSSLVAMSPFLILSSINVFFLQHSCDLHLFYLCGFISLLLLVIGITYQSVLVR